MELSLISGEWWNGNVIDIMNEAMASGGIPNFSDAYVINGKPGNLYPCSQNGNDLKKFVKIYE